MSSVGASMYLICNCHVFVDILVHVGVVEYWHGDPLFRSRSYFASDHCFRLYITSTGVLCLAFSWFDCLAFMIRVYLIKSIV